MTIPSDIAGLVSWFKADAITGLSDGANVATWTDSSGTGNATQATTANQPIYKTNIVNSLPVVRFQDTTDFLSVASPGTYGATTIFAVVKFPNTTADAPIFRHTSNGGIEWRSQSPGVLNLDRRGISNVFTGSTTLSTTIFTVVALSNDNPGDVHTQYINGAVESTATANGSNPDSSGAYDFGLMNASGNFDYAELIVYNTVLSPSDRDAITSYLGTKYAITVTTSGASASSPPPLYSTPPGRVSPRGRWAPFIGDTTPSATTTASAAAGVGTAGDAAIAVAPVAGNAAGTGAGNGPTPNLGVGAGLAAGTGAANQPTINTSPNVPAAAATGAAYAATTSSSGSGSAAPGYGQGTGAALAPSVTTSPNVAAGNSAATATATASTVALSPPVGVGAGSGVARAATVNVATVAGVASGTGAARPLGTGSAPAGVAAAAGVAGSATVQIDAPVAPGLVRIHTTIRPERTIDVDPAELESLTRQGLLVGVPAPPRPSSPPDPIAAHANTTIHPGVLVDVGAAELESLTRQGLLVGIPAVSRIDPPEPVVAYVYTTLKPGVLIGVGAAELESLTRQRLLFNGGYGTSGYGTSPYGY